MQQEKANYVSEKTQTPSPLPSSLLGIQFAQDNNFQSRLSDHDPWSSMASEASPYEVQNELSPTPERAQGTEEHERTHILKRDPQGQSPKDGIQEATRR